MQKIHANWLILARFPIVINASPYQYPNATWFILAIFELLSKALLPKGQDVTSHNEICPSTTLSLFNQYACPIM